MGYSFADFKGKITPVDIRTKEVSHLPKQFTECIGYLLEHSDEIFTMNEGQVYKVDLTKFSLIALKEIHEAMGLMMVNRLHSLRDRVGKKVLLQDKLDKNCWILCTVCQPSEKKPPHVVNAIGNEVDLRSWKILTVEECKELF